MAELLVIVPTRGRPESVQRVARAWLDTGAYEDARLVFHIDADDPERARYYAGPLPAGCYVKITVADHWQPMVPKLNTAAVFAAERGDWRGIAFMGDDHLPRTPGWARRYLDALAELGTGIVYGDDLVQGERLPTQWAMTSDIVRALGRMVPAPVEHLYCDNAILALGREAGCIRYLPEVIIEHCHPVAGTGELDDQYRRVNSPGQYARDEAACREWLTTGLAQDAAAVRALREEVASV